MSGLSHGVTSGVASLDNVQLVPVNDLLRRAGSVAPERWPDFCDAMGAVMAR